MKKVYPKNSVVVRNLPFNANEEMLREIFSPVGGVMEIDIVRDPESGRFRGFAVVTLSGEEEVKKAVLDLTNQECGGRNLIVEAIVN
jgi:RNA recognition motif-containing protein